MESICIVYIGDIFHRYMNKCENFSSRCLSYIIESDYGSIKNLCPHSILEVFTLFGPKDEEKVRSTILRPAVGHLICSIGAELRFHDLDDNDWLSNELNLLSIRNDISGILLISRTLRRLHQVQQYLGVSYVPTPRQAINSCELNAAHKQFMLKCTELSN